MTSRASIPGLSRFRVEASPVEPVPPNVHNRPMPLAHPISATPTANYSDPAIAISFATAKPGEDVDAFQFRINSRGGEWGQSRYGRERVELVLTEDSVERLVELLARVNRSCRSAGEIRRR